VVKISYNNSDKEFYYALFTKIYKNKIEDITKVNLNDIELDKNIDNRKVDIYAVTNENKEVFVELQLGITDSVHLNQLKTIIETQENNMILVWIATDFKVDMLNEIEKEIKLSSKNISFIALKLNVEVIAYLETLNKIFITEVIANLNILNKVDNHLKIIENFYRLQDESNIDVYAKKAEETLDLNNKHDVMKCLFNELRRQIYYYPSIHRDKKLDNNVIVLAGGKAEISYFIGISRKNMLFVEIRFGELVKDIFYELVKKEEEINDRLDYMAEFDVANRRIGTYIYFFSNKNKEVLIKRMARITDKYIRYFTQYTFSNTTG
jgi:hypothetical protein